MPTFTKKHYNKVAELLSGAKLSDDEDLVDLDNYSPYTIRDQWLEVRDRFNREFKKNNKLFDENKFLKKCEGGEFK